MPQRDRFVNECVYGLPVLGVKDLWVFLESEVIPYIFTFYNYKNKIAAFLINPLPYTVEFQCAGFRAPGFSQ